MAENQAPVNNTENPDVNFVVHNVYVKDVSFEAPNTPHVFSVEWNPKLDFDMEMGHTTLADGVYEVLINVTVKVDLEPTEEMIKKDPKKEPETAFLVEVKQAGIFSLQGVGDGEKIEHILSTIAPSILFPYIREAVSNLVTKGGFPQLILPPMNFEAMYRHQLHQTSQQQEQA